MPWVPLDQVEATGRSPHGERGLKYHHIANREHGLVALLMESVD